jgi:hypothetical protein
MIVKLVLVLTEVEVTKLKRPIRGKGGFQDLLRRLRSNLIDGRIMVDKWSDIEKVIRYSNKYGRGGFQMRYPQEEE